MKKPRKLRFIPFRKADLVAVCKLSEQLDDEQRVAFGNFCRLLESVFHYEYHQLLERLKSAYAGVNPDADTKPLVWDGERINGHSEVELLPELVELLNSANYERLSKEDLQVALNEESLFKIRLEVAFEDFEEVLLFVRGESMREEMISSWFGLRSRKIRFLNYDRVMLYLKFKKNIDSERIALMGHRPGATVLKLFQNVPQADLEMLFPNTRVRMKTIDKLMIGVPAVISGGVVAATKLGTTFLLLGSLLGFWLGLHSQPVELNQASLLALVAGVGALGSYLWKQFNNFKNRKIRFMQALTENLYFKSLDNNAGVFHRLIDAAEEEECKEAILGYFFLLTAGEPLDAHHLDHRIERWFEDELGTRIDFEVHDAIAKLLRLGLVQQRADLYHAVSLEQACLKLDRHWDNYFQYSEGNAA